MTTEIFTGPWAERWAQQLNSSDAYRAAASDWLGSICFRLRARERGRDRSVFLDLERGVCEEARAASARDLTDAKYVLAAREKVWQRLLAGELDPLWALMSGRIRLERGKLSDFASHTQAAKELVLAAQRISAVEPSTEVLAPAVPEPAAGSGVRDGFQTTAPQGLDFDLFPMRLWQKAKRMGAWDPQAVEFRQDQSDWRGLSEGERDVLLRLTALFQGGEEAVAVDLLPLIQAIAAEGRLEEEIYLASFLFDEAKHVETFRLFLDQVADERGDLARYDTPSYRRIFCEELPTALRRLQSDPSPRAQAEASTTYNMIVEGVLAETGYRGYYEILERHRILPGMLELVGHLQADEARHMAYGVYLLSRLVAEHGEPVWEAIENRMSALIEPALGMIHEIFAAYETMPFGLVLDDFTDFAQQQFERRMKRIERARRQTLDEILRPKAAV